METRKLIIIRGASGTGKSTIASHLQNLLDAPIHEADNFWLRSWFGGQNDSGCSEYKFDPKKLGQAHMWCQLNVEKQLHEGVKTVIVSNTSMALREMRPYLNLAEEYGYEIEVIRTPGPWDASVLFERNVHGVPLATLEKQISKYQPHETETEWTDLSVFN